jgi:hypothetical protein
MTGERLYRIVQKEKQTGYPPASKGLRALHHEASCPCLHVIDNTTLNHKANERRINHAIN